MLYQFKEYTYRKHVVLQSGWLVQVGIKLPGHENVKGSADIEAYFNYI
jgi:hypothetical protein